MQSLYVEASFHKYLQACCLTDAFICHIKICFVEWCIDCITCCLESFYSFFCESHCINGFGCTFLKNIMPDMWNLNWWLVLLYYWQQNAFKAMFHFCLFKPSVFCLPCQILMEALYSEDKLWITWNKQNKCFYSLLKKNFFCMEVSSTTQLTFCKVLCACIGRADGFTSA